MPNPEWYRRVPWTPDDQHAFQERLKRSRSLFHKAQYLRIQALTLAELGTPEMLTASLELLEQLLTKYPDPSQLASAHQHRGQCLADLGRPDDAFAAFESALEAESRFPNLRTGVQADYGDLAIALRRSTLYPRVTELVGTESPAAPSLFPAVDYRLAVIRAFLAAERKAWPTVKREAHLALAAAAKTQTSMRYHRRLGLVTTVDPDVDAQLRAWCNLTTA